MIDVTETVITYYNINHIRCEKCNGTGFQQRNDGVFVICPVCKGSGQREVHREIKSIPSRQWYPIPSPLPNFWYTDYDAQTKYIIC